MEGTYIKFLNNKVIHVNPHGTAPVILVRAVEGRLLAQRAYAVRAPELVFVGDQVQNVGEVCVVGVEEAG